MFTDEGSWGQFSSFSSRRSPWAVQPATPAGAAQQAKSAPASPLALNRHPWMRMPQASASATPRLSAREAAPRENSLQRKEASEAGRRMTRSNIRGLAPWLAGCLALDKTPLNEEQGSHGVCTELLAQAAALAVVTTAAAAAAASAAAAAAAGKPSADAHRYWAGTSLLMSVKALT